MINQNEGNKKLDQPQVLKPFITNLVAIANFSCEFDLQKIAQGIKNAKYNPHIFPFLRLTIDEPKATAIIYPHGKVHILKAKTPDEAYIVARRVMKILSKLDYNLRMKEFKIMSLTAISDCHFSVDVASMAQNPLCKAFVHYRPGRFEGLVFRIPDCHASSLIFPSGRVIFSGAKSLEDINKAISFIWPIIKLYKTDSHKHWPKPQYEYQQQIDQWQPQQQPQFDPLQQYQQPPFMQSYQPQQWQQPQPPQPFVQYQPYYYYWPYWQPQYTTQYQDYQMQPFYSLYQAYKQPTGDWNQYWQFYGQQQQQNDRWGWFSGSNENEVFGDEQPFYSEFKGHKRHHHHHRKCNR